MSKAHVKTEVGLSKDIYEMHDDLGKKTREFDALTAKIGKLKERLETLRDASKANEKKMKELESRVASDTKAIAHLGTLLMDHC